MLSAQNVMYPTRQQDDFVVFCHASGIIEVNGALPVICVDLVRHTTQGLCESALDIYQVFLFFFGKIACSRASN